jgi:hypothetical protein
MVYAYFLYIYTKMDAKRKERFKKQNKEASRRYWHKITSSNKGEGFLQHDAQRKRVERAGERVSLKSNAVLSNKKRIFERARKRRFRKKLKKAGGKVEIIRFSVVCVEMPSNIE